MAVLQSTLPLSVSAQRLMCLRDHFTRVNLKNSLWASVKHQRRMLVSVSQAKKLLPISSILLTIQQQVFHSNSNLPFPACSFHNALKLWIFFSPSPTPWKQGRALLYLSWLQGLECGSCWTNIYWMNEWMLLLIGQVLISPYPAKNPKSQWISCSTRLKRDCRSLSCIYSPCAQPEAVSSLVQAHTKVEKKTARGLMEASVHFKACAYNEYMSLFTTHSMG